MKQELKAAIDKVLPEVLSQAAAVRSINRMVPIRGERFTLPLKGRDIDIAYYRAKSEHAPLLIGLHGGGFLFGGSALDDDLWVNVTEMLDVNAASINYRMSPEVMDEACLYDAYDSAAYLIAHADEFGFDPAHVSVFGCSAGGNLSAALAILAGMRKDLKLQHQILVYPFLDGATDPDTKGEGSFSGLFPQIMNYLHFSPEKAKDPLLSPYYADKQLLKDLPPAIIVYCENDNLRKEAVEYAGKLKEAGVPVAEMLAERMPHGYLESGFKDHFTDIEKEMLGESFEELVSTGLLRRTSEETLEFIKKNLN